jgi:hypothetical protein
LNALLLLPLLLARCQHITQHVLHCLVKQLRRQSEPRLLLLLQVGFTQGDNVPQRLQQGCYLLQPRPVSTCCRLCCAATHTVPCTAAAAAPAVVAVKPAGLLQVVEPGGCGQLLQLLL